jgi:ribosomal protein L35
MPKMKTKKIVVKRFKVTKNGKIMHRVQGARHLRRNKSKSRQRRQDKMHEVTTKKFKQIVNQFIYKR